MPTRFLLLFLTLASHVCCGHDLGPPLITNVVAASFDFDSDTHPEFDYSAARGPNVQPPQEYYFVSFALRSFGSGHNVQATSIRIPFQSGEPVSADSPLVITEGGGNWVSLGGYHQARTFPGATWRYYDVTKDLPDAYWRSRTELIFGIRFALEDGVHYGWIRFARPDTYFTTPFELASYDWHPIPGEPIGAGLPPVVPIIPQMTPEGLRLTWSGSLAHWTLEFAEELHPDALWQPVPGVGGADVIVDAGETQRFYRLRRP